MPRPTRIEYEHAFYHVMNRGRGRITLFHSTEYYHAFLETLAEAYQRFDAIVHAYDEELSGIVIPVFDNRRGHPLLVDMKYGRDIEKLDLEHGPHALDYSLLPRDEVDEQRRGWLRRDHRHRASIARIGGPHRDH